MERSWQAVALDLSTAEPGGEAIRDRLDLAPLVAEFEAGLPRDCPTEGLSACRLLDRAGGALKLIGGTLEGALGGALGGALEAVIDIPPPKASASSPSGGKSGGAEAVAIACRPLVGWRSKEREFREDRLLDGSATVRENKEPSKDVLDRKLPQEELELVLEFSC